MNHFEQQNNKENKEDVNFKEKKEILDLGKKYDNEMEFLQQDREMLMERAINMDIFSKNIDKKDLKFTQYMVDEIVKHINAPIITDSFDKDHSKRRLWFRKHLPEISSKASEYHQSNKLRLNKINAVISSTEHLLYLDCLKEDVRIKIKELNQELHKIIDNYSNLELEEKIRIVEEVDQKAKELLNVISNVK